MFLRGSLVWKLYTYAILSLGQAHFSQAPHIWHADHSGSQNCGLTSRLTSDRVTPVPVQNYLELPAETPARPWAQFTMEFTVELPKSGSCRTVLRVVDQLTQMVHFIPGA